MKCKFHNFGCKLASGDDLNLHNANEAQKHLGWLNLFFCLLSKIQKSIQFFSSNVFVFSNIFSHEVTNFFIS